MPNGSATVKGTGPGITGLDREQHGHPMGLPGLTGLDRG